MNLLLNKKSSNVRVSKDAIEPQSFPVVDPDLELRKGGGRFLSLALSVFLPSANFFLSKIRKRGGPPLDLPLVTCNNRTDVLNGI